MYYVVLDWASASLCLTITKCTEPNGVEQWFSILVLAYHRSLHFVCISYHFSHLFYLTLSALWSGHHRKYRHDSPVEKNSICWLGMFWSMAAGLSWSCAGRMLVLSHSCSGPAHDQLRTSLNQLKPAAMLQNIPNQHMLFFFQQGSVRREHMCSIQRALKCARH